MINIDKKLTFHHMPHTKTLYTLEVDGEDAWVSWHKGDGETVGTEYQRSQVEENFRIGRWKLVEYIDKEIVTDSSGVFTFKTNEREYCATSTHDGFYLVFWIGKNGLDHWHVEEKHLNDMIEKGFWTLV